MDPPLHPTSFFTILSGPPGSGKTSTALNLLIQNWAYRGKYDYVFIVSPSLPSFPQELIAGIPQDQIYTELDDNVLKEILSKVRSEEFSGKKVLILLDDVVTEIGRRGHNDELIRLILNRRHLTTHPGGPRGGFVSVIVATQKYNMIPKRLRINATSTWMFPTQSAAEKRNFREDLTESLSKQGFEEATQQAWWNPHAPLIQLANGDWWATRAGSPGALDFYELYSDRLKYGHDRDPEIIRQEDDDEYLERLIGGVGPIRTKKSRRHRG